MSGHSKWSTIKRKKGAADAKRGAAFTRISKDITLAAREGGGDPDMNPTLRLAIKNAKSANMPATNVQRAINKGLGNLPGIKYENYIYEGYGPGGTAIMMEVMTDNKNRTVPDIRHIMSKTGGNLGEQGCVNWMFEKKGIITISKDEIDEDIILEKSLDLGAEDFSNIISSSISSFDIVIIPFFSNIQFTHPCSPKFPPVLDIICRISGTVLFLLSVITSIIIAVPPGPYPSYI
jgi:YebC/PmpR family DNA-binding regulatory protein